MAQNSKIEWTSFPRLDGTLMQGHTVNLWWGCVSVSEGCQNCYAETLSKRFGDSLWGKDAPRKMIKSAFSDLDKFQKIAEKANEIHRVFVGSMMDIFEKPMPLIDSKGNDLEITDTGNLRNRFFSKIMMNKYPNLMFLLLTKRPSNINKYIPESWKTNPPKNVMFGTSPVNQKTFNDLVGQLMKVNGNKFLSVEPQLDYISIETLGFGGGGINWIIQGGESGHHKRPFNLEWARSMRDECKSLGIPYFFKQIDKIQPIPDDLMVREFPKIDL